LRLRERNNSNSNSPPSPFNRSNKNTNNGATRVLKSPTNFLTHEQRLIIDNASEEQGNSDQSIEKIVMINEDIINQSIGDMPEDDEEIEEKE